MKSIADIVTLIWAFMAICLYACDDINRVKLLKLLRLKTTVWSYSKTVSVDFAKQKTSNDKNGCPGTIYYYCRGVGLYINVHIIIIYKL